MANEESKTRLPSMKSTERAGQIDRDHSKDNSLSRQDSEFGRTAIDEDESEVLLSPKSSVVSSRMAKPEVTEVWQNKLIHFHHINA